MPELNRVTIYQTEGGKWCSFPHERDVKALLSGDTEWEEGYTSCGHGEYVENIYAVAEFCRTHNVTPKAAIYSAVIEYR